MTSANTAENTEELNQQSLATLARSIAVSQGRFALTLVRCNYTALQQRLTHSLKAICPVHIQNIALSPNSENLYQSILPATSHQRSSAVMVSGLENVDDLANFLCNLELELATINSRCHFPVILWLTDETLGQLIKLAPKFYASAVTAITLRPSTAELDILWREGADRLMGAIISMGLDQFVINEHLSFCAKAKLRQEMKSAIKDLRSQNALPPALTATWYLVLGRDHFTQGEVGNALVHFQKSLQIWEQLQGQTITGELLSFTHHTLQTRWALVKLHMGFCYHQQATTNNSSTHWQLAKTTFISILRVFEQQQRWDLVKQVLTLTGDCLRALEHWLELENIANAALAQPELEVHPLNLAQAHGFLAEVALHDGEFDRAAQQARTALALTTQHQITKDYNDTNLARYLLLVAKAEARSHEFPIALERLEKAKSITASNTQLYIEIIHELRLLYYHTGQFWESFQLKQQHQLLRHQQGLAAFVGTAAGLQPPSTNTKTVNTNDLNTALGRERDIRILVDRLSEPEQKLIILHGESGMGKSSLLMGGVLPALTNQVIQGRKVAIAQVLIYNNWLAQLSESLAQNSGQSALPGAASMQHLLKMLNKNIDQKRLTILFFDQFEEFFTAVSSNTGRQEFYQFFQTCLTLPHVKMAIAIRQADLHQLLELERFIDLSSIDNNLLDQRIRYPLRNFTLPQAQEVVLSLTNRCHYYLEPDLAEQLVSDLANEHAEVSPIQLQVIGAQLQAENIKTLGQYFQLSSQPQQFLVERALEECIRDCGKENFEAVLTALFLLTDGRGNRPQRTFSQLLPATENHQRFEQPRRNSPPILMAHQHNYYARLMLLLNILVGSGIVICIKSEPENLYQLVHENLVETVRAKYHNRAAHAPRVPRRSFAKAKLRQYQHVSSTAWKRWIEPWAPTAQQISTGLTKEKIWLNVSSFALNTVNRTGISKLARPLFSRLIGKKL